MNEHAIANVCLYLIDISGQNMFVKMYFFKLTIPLKHYKLMLKYLARNLKADLNI